MGYKKYFPRSSLILYLTSLVHQFSYKMIMKWWAREVIFHFPHSSFHFIWILMTEGSWYHKGRWPREANLKFSWKKVILDTFFLYPGFLATYGNLSSIPTKSTWKMPAFGTGFIRGTQGNHIEKGLAKTLILVVKYRSFAFPTSNYLGSGPILRPFNAKLGNSI